MPKAKNTRADKATPALVTGPHYRIDIADLHSHRFAVTLTISRPAQAQRVSLPVWIPGSYLVREFAKHLQSVRAEQSGKAVPLQQLDKHTWQATCQPGQHLVLHYELYALDNSVRTAWLDAQRGFFNGTSLCLQVAGQESLPHTLDLVASPATAHWSVATGLTPTKVNKQGFGAYRAAHYDELVDCPVEMGAFWSGSFTACGVTAPLCSCRSSCPRLTAHVFWQIPRRFVRRRFSFGMAAKSRPTRIRLHSSTPWTMAMEGWSTAIPQP